MTKNQGLADIEQTSQGINNQKQNGQTLTIKKRIIWVTGGKGGTGKSTFARGLLDALMEAGIDVVAFDGDPDNSQLFRFYKDSDVSVTRIGIHKRNGADDIITEMEDVGTPVILVDVPAGGGNILSGLEDEVGFLSAIAEVGYQLTVVTVLSRIKDSVNQLKLAMDITEGYDVAHVAVKNLYYGRAEQFSLLERSNTMQRLTDNGGVVIKMRDLFDDTYERLDEADLSFQAAMMSGSGVIAPDVRKIGQWRKHFKAQVAETGGLLGL